MTGKLVYYLLLHSMATFMGRTGVATSMPINPITTTVSAVSDPGLTSIYWILLLSTFLHIYIALSTHYTLSTQTKLKLLQLVRTPTIPNSCYTRNNYAPRGLYGTLLVPPHISDFVDSTPFLQLGFFYFGFDLLIESRRHIVTLLIK